MFLKKTLLEKNNESKVLLGEWAREKENDSVEVVSYHWEDMQKLENDNNYIFRLYKIVIPNLAKELNYFHKKDYSNRYWEILVGPWLLKFIEILFDRFYMIKSASKEYSKLETLIVDTITRPYSFSDFQGLSQKDFFNLELYSQILKKNNFQIKLTEISLSKVEKNILLTNKLEVDLKENLNNIQLFNLSILLRKTFSFIKITIRKIYSPIRYSLNFYWKKKAEKCNEFLNLNLPFKKSDIKRLYFLLNQTYYETNNIPDFFSPKININDEIRNKSINIDLDTDDDFLKLILDLTFKFIPIEYLENFISLSNHYKPFLPKHNIKLVAVRCAVEYGFKMRFFMSELHEKGAKILSCQEGGGVGVRKFNKVDEDMYLIGCDNFLTWGWTPINKKGIKFSMTKTFWIKDYNYNYDGKIILAGGSCRRYLYSSIHEGHLPSFNKRHLDLNSQLIKNLNEDAFKILIYRFHIQRGYLEIDKILENNRNLKISTRENNPFFYDLLYSSRLIICTSDYTANLQPLILNHPTIWLWDSNYFIPRDTVKEYYDLLNKAGILYYNAEECAKKINEICQNPMKWWMTEKVQNARNIFCNNICKLDKNMINNLAKIIKANIS